ncbi:hypothetical protein C818_00390 [Lachnospiraceae bacterium MD308]|jgi:hypothetical protein|nr:hypothetical protein C818_00390 [Lachnospiraceae bacterium MD308]
MRKKKRLPSVNKGTHALCSLRVQELTIKDNFMFGAVMVYEGLRMRQIWGFLRHGLRRQERRNLWMILLGRCGSNGACFICRVFCRRKSIFSMADIGI